MVYSDPNGIPGDADDVPTRVSGRVRGRLSAVDRRLHPRRRDPPARRRAERAGDGGRRVGRARARARAVQRRDDAPRRARAADHRLRREPEPDPGRTNPDVRRRAASAATITENGAPRRVFICRSQQVTLADLPLIHPTAGCIDSPTNPRGVPSCFEWAQPRPRRGVVRRHRAAVPERARRVLVQLPRRSSRSRPAICARRTSTATDHDAERRARRRSGVLPADRALRARALLARHAAAVREREELPRRGRRHAQHGARGGQRALRAPDVHLARRRRGGAALRPAQRARLRDRLRRGPHPDELGLEFTWIEGVPYGDADVPSGISDTDELNFAVSVDRPTFIRFAEPEPHRACSTRSGSSATCPTTATASP